MHSDVAGEIQTVSPSRRRGVEKKGGLFPAKLLVAGACFWYVSRQVDLSEVWSAVSLLDFRWAAFAIAMVMVQIPLVAARWHRILGAIAAFDARMTPFAMVAATA